MVLLMIAVALAMRTDCPARHPSPKKSPGSSIATTASRPVFELTESFTPPLWIYRTLSHGSPWAKMTSVRRYSTIFLAIPTELRNAWALNAPVGLDSMATPLENRLTGGLARRLRWTAGRSNPAARRVHRQSPPVGPRPSENLAPEGCLDPSDTTPGSILHGEPGKRNN